MGENAKRVWEWHNTIVGEGYQAKGVIRQRTGDIPQNPIIDKTKSLNRQDESNYSIDHNNEKLDRKSVKKAKKSKHKKHKAHKDNKSQNCNEDNKAATSERFNPLLQYFASCLQQMAQEI